MSTLEMTYRPRGGAAEVFRCFDPEVLLDGPARTGKSRAVGERILQLATTHGGCRIAVIRKTRASLTESFLQMWEDRVLGDGLDRTYLKKALDDGAGRSHRVDYEFRNGSLVVPAGMDAPTRLYSTEWDVIYVQEAIELTLDEWERLTRGLTNKKIPHPQGRDPETGEPRFLAQLIGDTNPDAPHHWLNLRCESGQTTRIRCKHSDNPSLTRQDLERLKNMTGVRRDRLYLGKWVTAEGSIWKNWDPALHIIDRPKPEQIKWTMASVDWGYTNAGVMQVWGIDGDRRMYLLHQVYRTSMLLIDPKDENDSWLKHFKRAHEKHKVETFVCDPSQPGNIETMRRQGLPAREADNDIVPGLNAVRTRLENRGDGKPGLFACRKNLEGRDPRLAEAMAPCCVEEEIPSYVFARSADGTYVKEKPAPEQADHGCDAMRYAVRFVDKYDLEPAAQKKSFGFGTLGRLLGHNVPE